MSNIRVAAKRFIAVAAVASLSFLSACSNTSSPDASTSSPATASAAAAAPADEVTIYLTRHGQTWFNLLGRGQGWSDTPLTEKGEAIALKLGEGLNSAGVEFDSVYSGDMVRHFTTASLILEGMKSDLEVTRVPDLREIAFGGFEGMPNSEALEIILEHTGAASMEELVVEGKSPNLQLAKYLKEANPDPLLKAESPEEVAERAQGALDKIASEEGAKGHDTILVVTSGLTVQILLDSMGYNVEHEIENASITTLVYSDGEWRIDGVGDTSLIDD